MHHASKSPEKLRYRKISTRFWEDRVVTELTSGTRFLFLCLLTCREITPLGIMTFNRDAFRTRTGLSFKNLRRSLSELEENGLIRMDPESLLIVIPNFLKHNPPENPNVVKSYIKLASEFPECDLLNEYMEDVIQILSEMGDIFIGPFKDSRWVGLIKHTEVGLGNPQGGVCEIRNRNRNRNSIPPIPPRGVGGGLVGFDRFWEAYPRRVGKGAALKAWSKLNPHAELVERIIEAVERQKLSREWLKDGGQYIPHPTTWLNQTRWEDELPSQAPSGPPGVNSAAAAPADPFAHLDPLSRQAAIRTLEELGAARGTSTATAPEEYA